MDAQVERDIKETLRHTKEAKERKPPECGEKEM